MTLNLQIKTFFVSLFIIFNLLTLLYYGTPQRFKKLINRTYKTIFNIPKDSNKRFPPFIIFERYAQITGLNNRWGMFASLERENWWLIIKARYKNNKTVILPLPKQSKRTFSQKYVFDFKEAQFRTRIYNNKTKQERFAEFLCRKFSKHNDSLIESIIFDRYEQKVFELKEANKLGDFLEPNIKHIGQNIFKCPEVYR